MTRRLNKTVSRTHRSTRAAAVAASLALAAACGVHADEVTYECSVVSSTSAVVQTTDLSSPFAGNLIGNWDELNNPTGTRTLPGLFGGSGNNPIPYTASFALAGDIDSQPTGSLRLGVDSEGLQIRVGDLELDLLGGNPGELAATINILYSTFRTVQPSSFYPGGVTIPIPVGNGSVSTLRMTQTGKPVFGVLVPQKGGTFTFAVAVPVETVLVADILGNPVSDGTPVPGILPLTGTLVEATQTVTLSLAISDSQSQTQPLELDPFVDQPLALPTVFPTGGTANLLLSGDVTSVTVGTALTATINVSGVRATNPADLNGDGLVNAADLTILLSAWGSSGPADLNGDGLVNAPDVTILLSDWG